MRRQVAIACSIGLLLAGCSVHPKINGSGRLATREMALADFTRIAVGSTFTAEVRRGDAFTVAITADDNLFDYLDVSREGSTLAIRLADVSLGSGTLEARVTLPALEHLEVRAGSRVKLEGFKGVERLTLVVSGASRVQAGFEAEEARIYCSGASWVSLAGSARRAFFEASSASSMDLERFSVVDASVVLTGKSSAGVNVTGRLDLHLSGASELSYAGNPRMGTQSLSGGSRVSPRGP